MNTLKHIYILTALTVCSPFWGCLYIQLLGKSVNRYIKGNTGILYTICNNEEKLLKINTDFERYLSNSGENYSLVFYGGIPMIPIIINTTISYIKYLHLDKVLH